MNLVQAPLLADYIARNANNHRQKLRPKEPVDLDFVLNDEHVPDKTVSIREQHDVMSLKTGLYCHIPWYPGKSPITTTSSACGFGLCMESHTDSNAQHPHTRLCIPL